MNCLSDKIHATDAEISDRFAAVGCNLLIGEGDEESITVTDDTIEDFRSARRLHWSEPGMVEIEQAGAYVIQGAQVAKGQPRECVVVVDFGQVRAVYRG